MIQFLRGTQSQLQSSQQIFAAGQPIFESDTGQLKIGNGINNFAGLPYVGGSSSGDEWALGSSSDGSNSWRYKDTSDGTRVMYGTYKSNAHDLGRWEIGPAYGSVDMICAFNNGSTMDLIWNNQDALSMSHVDFGLASVQATDPDEASYVDIWISKLMLTHSSRATFQVSLGVSYPGDRVTLNPSLPLTYYYFCILS